ncbi:phytoene/squalene synthase family protein [Streptoverticillium reticulum]|uniref:phytoene/squalene synthase family protein n=1 Tax=Streptomyces TaxID=1883 RepID=UPI0036A888D5
MTVHELDLAGITDSGLRADYLKSSRLFRDIGRGRFLGRYMFPAAKRPYFDTFFSFVCYVDDLVDDVNRSLEVRKQRLDEFERAYLAACDGEETETDGPPSGDHVADAALSRALVHMMRTWDLPYRDVPQFVQAQREALTTYEYATYEEMDPFIQGVTLLPAVWINGLFEPQSEDSEELCRHTITAFQLLDFAWDVQEDLELGRLYLPLEDLTKFGLDRTSLAREVGSGHVSEAVRELMKFEIDRAVGHLDAGRAWGRTLHPTSRTFVDLDIETHRQMAVELVKDDYAFFGRPKKGLGFNSAKIAPRTAAAAARAKRINREAEQSGYRIRRPWSA